MKVTEVMVRPLRTEDRHGKERTAYVGIEKTRADTDQQARRCRGGLRQSIEGNQHNETAYERKR